MLSGRKKGPPLQYQRSPPEETPHHQREVSGPAGQTAAGGAEAVAAAKRGGVLPPRLGQRAGHRASRSTSPGPDAALGQGRAPPHAGLSRRAPQRSARRVSFLQQVAAPPSCLCRKHPGAPGRPGSRPQRLLPDSPDAHPRGPERRGD